MIKDVGSKFDDYSILPKIRQILLHWSYELNEKGFFINSTKLMHKNELLSFQMKINLAKNKRKIFQKKSVEYYLQNKEAIKEKSKN